MRHSNSVDCQETHNPFKENRNSSIKSDHSPNSSSKKSGRRTLSGAKVQVRKFRMETKAAKTLAIIVGNEFNTNIHSFIHNSKRKILTEAEKAGERKWANEMEFLF
jgi:hypothetical protein